MVATTLARINAANVDTIAAGEPEWLSKGRRDAMAKYLSLPAEVSPLYSKYSDTNRIKPQDVHLSLAPAKQKVSSDLAKRLEELEKETGVLQIGA